MTTRKAMDIADRGDEGLAGSGEAAGDPTLLGRKQLLMGALASMGFVIANAAQPPAGAAGTTKPFGATLPTYIPKWSRATAYAPGQQVISPNNDVVSAKVTHTSSATYAADQAKWTLSSTYARGGSQPFGQGGSATVGSSGAWMAPFPLTVTRVVLSCIGAPVGSALMVNFKHDGVTFATCAIPAGTTKAVTAAAHESVAELGALRVTATSVGSATAATDIVAQMDWVKS